MPDMTGDRFAEAVKEIRPDTPVVLCTGFTEHDHGLSQEEMRIEGFLKKPVDKTELAALVRAVLDESKNTISQ